MFLAFRVEENIAAGTALSSSDTGAWFGFLVRVSNVSEGKENARKLWQKKKKGAKWRTRKYYYCSRKNVKR